MQLVNIVAHKINKAKNVISASIKWADELLINSDEKVLNFAESVRNLYTKGTAKSYGKFEESTSDNSFRRIMEKYLNSTYTFMEYTHELMELLKINMQQQPLATGGYVVFMHYVDTADYIMVVMLKDKSSLAFTDDLSLSNTSHIDLDKLHAVVRVNPAEMQAGNVTYLTFTSNHSNTKDIAAYFTNFVGCAEYTESKELTGTLVSTIKTFAKLEATDPNGDVDDGRRHKIIKTAFEYCDERRKSNKLVNIDALSRAMLPDEPDKLTNYISSNSIVLNTEFVPHTTTLRKLTMVQLTGKGYKFTFERDCVGQIFILDKENQTLTIPISEDDIKNLEE